MPVGHKEDCPCTDCQIVRELNTLRIRCDALKRDRDLWERTAHKWHRDCKEIYKATNSEGLTLQEAREKALRGERAIHKLSRLKELLIEVIDK